MTGYKNLIMSFFLVLIAPIAFIFGLVKMLLPSNLGEALINIGLYIISGGNWIGYLTAALYYILNEYGYGAMFC